MSHEPSSDEILGSLLFGETDEPVLADLAARAASNEEFARRLAGELRFSEWLRLALDGTAADPGEEFLRALEGDGLSAEDLGRRLREGEARRFECDRLARGLWEDPDAARRLRRELAEEELLRQALVESKGEDAFLASLETRMWAETRRDRFVDEFAKRLDREASPLPPEPASEKIVAFPFSRVLVRVAAAAALAAGAYFAAENLAVRSKSGAAPAFVVKTTPDATWADGAVPRHDEPLAPGIHELKSGVVSLRLADGGELAVEGPARFEVGEDASARVHAGIALARAPLGEGRVNLRARDVSFTEPARLVAIDARREGATEAVVLDGVGGICLGDSSSCRDLAEFEAVKADHLRSRLVDVPYNPRAFSKAWSLVAGVADNLGRVRIELPGSVLSALGAEDGEVRVFVENESFRPEGGVEVDRVAVGEFALAESNPGQRIEGGMELRSYLLELPAGDGGEVETSLTFDHPVVGVVFTDERLAGTDEVVGYRVAEPETDARRGLDSGEDEILISEDRRTLSLRSKGASGQAEQVRVLVALN